MIDIAVNLANTRFSSDIEAVIMRAREAGVKKIIITASSIAETRVAIALCDQYNQQFPNLLYTTAGIHPHESASLNQTSIATLKQLATALQVVAIGETGLDFNRNLAPQKQQEIVFEAQLELASEVQIPLFMHERDAAQRQIDILKTYRDTIVSGVIHCFTGDKKTLFSYLDMDLHIGITGWICDERRGLALQTIAKNIPLNRLMIETDAPYLLPRNMPSPPKNRRNEPAFLPWVLAGIAAARGESAQDIARATTATAERFFNLS